MATRGADAPHRFVTRLRHASERIRLHGESIAQSALAAGLAWFIAANLLGHQRAFFAPVAALIALGIAPGRRTSRAAQLVVGIGLGILIGELFLEVIGTGFVQVAIVAAVALLVAVGLDESPMFASQVTVSAVLVATLEPLSPGSSPTRFLDAVIGGAIGLGVLAVATRDPMRSVRAGAGASLDRLAGILERLADAMASEDAAAARRLQAEAAGTVPALGELLGTIDRSHDVAVLRVGRGTVHVLSRYRDAVRGLLEVAGDTAALARSVARAVDLGEPVPFELVIAVRDLGRGVRLLGAAVVSGASADEARSTIATAAGIATAGVPGHAPMPIGALVGDIRATAADLLRASGLNGSEAVARVRQAGRRRPAADRAV